MCSTSPQKKGLQPPKKGIVPRRNNVLVVRLTSAAYPNEPVASNAGEVGVRVKARPHGAEVREDPPGRTRGPSP